jgi:hypothetical protein
VATVGDANPGSARSTYELHLIHPTTAARHSALIKDVLLDIVLKDMTGSVIFSKVTTEIIDLRTGVAVLTMRETPDVAQGLVDLVNADLDRLDAASFAKEWGIKPSAGSDPEAAASLSTETNDPEWYQTNGVWFCRAHETRYCKICSSTRAGPTEPEPKR